MSKVLLCGPCPEPTGGVSVHIDRLGRILENEKFNVIYCDESPVRKSHLFNLRSLNIKDYFLMVINSDVIHIHSSVGIFRFIHLFSSAIFLKKSIVTIHSWREGKLSSLMWGWMMSIVCHKIIFVSKEVSEKISIARKKKIIYPAFIPPNKSHQNLPDSILNFVEMSKSKNKKIVVSNAFRLINFDGCDLYGIDLCIKAFEDGGVDDLAVLIFVISDPSVNSVKIKEFVDYVKDNNLENKIHIHLGMVDFCDLLQISDLSIRATNTDGDALSVRESIFFRKPCIASDVVIRPDLTILFKNRSYVSLLEKIHLTLNADFKNYFPKVDLTNNITMFYKELYI